MTRKERNAIRYQQYLANVKLRKAEQLPGAPRQRGTSEWGYALVHAQGAPIVKTKR